MTHRTSHFDMAAPHFMTHLTCNYTFLDNITQAYYKTLTPFPNRFFISYFFVICSSISELILRNFPIHHIPNAISLITYCYGVVRLEK